MILLANWLFPLRGACASERKQPVRQQYHKYGDPNGGRAPQRGLLPPRLPDGAACGGVISTCSWARVSQRHVTCFASTICMGEHLPSTPVFGLCTSHPCRPTPPAGARR